MNQQSASSANPTIQQRQQKISASFREFYRQSLAQRLSPESAEQIESIVTQAEEELQTASERENPSTEAILTGQAVASAIVPLRQAKKERADLVVTWFDLSDSKLPANPQDLVQNIQQAMAKLPEKQRRILGMFWTGLTVEEIADLLGYSVRKAQRQLEQAQKTIYKLLEGEGIEYEVN